MKYFYSLIVSICFCVAANAQLSKPLNPPSELNGAASTVKKKINPLPAGFRSQRTSVATTFAPRTQPALQRTMSNKRLKIVQRSKEGQPIMIKGSLQQQSSGRALDLQIFDYLEEIKNPILIKKPQAEFAVIDRHSDDLEQTHIKLQQQYNGIKVYGGQVWLHVEKGQVNLFNGRNFPTPNIENATPSIDAAAAQTIANQDVSTKTIIKQLKGLEQKLIGEQKAPELVIYHPIGSKVPQLVWHLKFHANVANEWEYFINAHSGEVIEAYKTLCQLHYKSEAFEKHLAEADCMEVPSTTEKVVKKVYNSQPQNGPTTAFNRDLNDFNRTVNAYEINGTFFMIDASRPMFSSTRSRLPEEPVGAIWTINAQNTYPENDNFEVIHLVNGNNDWDDPTSVSAHYNAGIAYDYFRSTFNRNSINGNGGTVVSIINVSDEDGSGLDNAFWSGSAMFYGNGKTAFDPLAKSLDVAGHEIAHGVIQNTANLRYQGESGAMNESFADVFGVLIDRDDYQLGEDVVNTSVFRSGALRDMRDPNNGGTRLGDPGYQPAHVNEQFFGRQDNGGVHINSGITNRAFFLVANSIGRDKAEQIYYRALTTYLVTTSQFVDLRASLLQAATDIHGGNSSEVSIIAQAFDAVGILGPDTGQGTDSGGAEDIEVEINPGQDFIVFTNDNQSVLYLADGNGNPLKVLSEKGVLSKPSITDDGSNVIFVGFDKKIHGVFLDWSIPTVPTEEYTIGDQPIWRNAAVSKQGHLLAALEDERKNKVDVFDLNTGEGRTFELYNPTSAEGISTGEVDYADVIEFNFSGEFLIYDAQNSISANFGNDGITYWDIGFIKVWDNPTDNFEVEVNNNIIKLFSGLPENVSIGNPTFSKNSPDVIAYEYIDAFDQTDELEPQQIYELRGRNIITNKEGTIFRSLNLQVPNFSRKDDQIIFNFLTDNTYNIATIGLNPDKISSPTEDGTFLIQQNGGAQLGVWFADGSRVLTSTNELEKSISDFLVSPNPFKEILTVQFSLEVRKELVLEVYNTLGQLQQSQVIEANVGANIQEIDTHLLPEGAYLITLKSEEGIISRKVVK